MEKEQLTLRGTDNRQLTLFDYSTLDLDTKTELCIDEAKLDLHFNQAEMHLWESGKILAKWRDKLSHNKSGGFEGWLNQRYPLISKMFAYRLINVATNFNCNNLLQLDSMAKSALYLLAAPSTPESARDEALSLAESGERITHQKAQELIARHKAEAEAAKAELEQERASRKQAIQQAITPLEDRLVSLESKRSSLTKERDFLLESKNKDGACIISQNQIIDQLKAQTIEPQVITQEVRVEVEKLVEVVPEDYEQLKKEINVLKKTLEDLKQESCEELSQHQTKVRKLTIELTKKEKLLESSSNEEQKQLKGIQKINEGMKCIEEACSLLGNRCENIFHPQLKEVIESSLQSLILFLNNFFCNDKNRK